MNHRLLNRSIFSHSIISPTISNGPLPRLKPQPDHISGMVYKRRKARTQRIEHQRALLSQAQDLQIEGEFKDSLVKKGGARFKNCFRGLPPAAWRAPIESRLTVIQVTFNRDTARAARPTPPELLSQLKAARGEKVANKTRERERQMRGEVLSVTRRQLRLGFPTHTLTLWDPETPKAKLTARRSTGKVGYIGQMKRAWLQNTSR